MKNIWNKAAGSICEEKTVHAAGAAFDRKLDQRNREDDPKILILITTELCIIGQSSFSHLTQNCQ